MTSTHVKDGIKLEVTLDLDAIRAALVSPEAFAACITLAKTAALHRLGDNWRKLEQGMDGTEWFLATLDAVNEESVRVTAADKKAAENLHPRAIAASAEDLAKAGVTLGFTEPVSTDLDTLAKQFARKRIADEAKRIESARSIL